MIFYWKWVCFLESASQNPLKNSTISSSNTLQIKFYPKAICDIERYKAKVKICRVNIAIRDESVSNLSFQYLIFPIILFISMKNLLLETIVYRIYDPQVIPVKKSNWKHFFKLFLFQVVHDSLSLPENRKLFHLWKIFILKSWYKSG